MNNSKCLQLNYGYLVWWDSQAPIPIYKYTIFPPRVNQGNHRAIVGKNKGLVQLLLSYFTKLVYAVQ